jgi:hypothetical protein
LAALDGLLLAVAPVGPSGRAAGSTPLTFSQSDQSQVERIYTASQMAAEPGVRSSALKAILYRTGQTSQPVSPPCLQDELTYGQVDPCG